jgi:hypothetical protein
MIRSPRVIDRADRDFARLAASAQIERRRIGAGSGKAHASG